MAVRLPALHACRPLPSRKISVIHFCYMLGRPQGHCAAGRIRWIERSNDPIGIRTRDFAACSVVPEQTSLPRAQEIIKCWTFFWIWKFVSWALKSLNFPLPLCFSIFRCRCDGDVFWRKCRCVSSRTFLASIQYFEPLSFHTELFKNKPWLLMSLYALYNSRQLKL
jgi:hypothetical protein